MRTTERLSRLNKAIDVLRPVKHFSQQGEEIRRCYRISSIAKALREIRAVLERLQSEYESKHQPNKRGSIRSNLLLEARAYDEKQKALEESNNKIDANRDVVGKGDGTTDKQEGIQEEEKEA